MLIAKEKKNLSKFQQPTTTTMTKEQVFKKRKAALAADVRVSKVFAPFRTVGNVSNGVAFAVGILGSTFYIVTSVGRSFQIYDANTLHLLFVSARETDANITSLTTHFHHVFAGFGNKIGIFKRGIQEHLIEIDNKLATVKHLNVFGDYLCVSTDENIVYIYKKRDSQDKFATEFYTKFTINSALQGGDIVSILHLPTYLNKIVVVTKSNVLSFNVKTGKLLYTSMEFPHQITVAEVAPVLDIIALGTVEGEIILFNLKKGKKIRTITVPQQRISTISFRTDGSSHLCVGTTLGDLIFYDLDRRSRIHVLKNIHRESFGGITKSCFLNGQPIVVTSGGDNTLKEYVFDPSLSTTDQEVVVQPPRFLRSRGGHSQPPTNILFADNESHFILSSSKDQSLWGFSLRKDAQSQEFSQKLHKKNDGNRIGGSTMKGKFSEITTMCIENSRLGDWENVITGHKDEKFARTWDMSTKRVGRWQFDTTDDGFVKSVAISQCGNFGFVGSSNGSIVIYNMQSGILRKKYKLHKRAVTGIALDGMNRKMVSCGLDGLVGFYDFNKSTLLGKLQLDAPITQMVYHRSSDLFALALDDLSIVVIDSLTQKIVRQLWGHSNRITSLDFSPDGRWIISSALDSTLRTWDLPTGGCIDGIKLNNVITNLKFSPNGDLLATTHVSGNGINIWTNKAQFKSVSTKMINEEHFAEGILPSNSMEGNSTILTGALDDEEEEEDKSSEVDDDEYYIEKYDSLPQINKDLITLSLGPRNKLNTLLNLDIIKQRSRPTEKITKSEKTPFFLQLHGADVGDEASNREGIIFETPEQIQERENAESQKLDAEDKLQQFKPSGRSGFESKFTILLKEGSATHQYDDFLKYLVSLPVNAVDLEIRSLNSFAPFEEMIWFINAITYGSSLKTNCELYEGYMSLLFKVHGDVIHMNNEHVELQEALKRWNGVHQQNESLDSIVKYCSNVINFVTTA